MNSIPSVKKLCKEFPDINDESAVTLRTMMARNWRQGLQYFDKLVQNHGIEYFEARVYGRNTQVNYSNTGDSYATTLLYVEDCRGSRWRIGCWADIAEKAL